MGASAARARAYAPAWRAAKVGPARATGFNTACSPPRLRWLCGSARAGGHGVLPSPGMGPTAAAGADAEVKPGLLVAKARPPAGPVAATGAPATAPQAAAGAAGRPPSRAPELPAVAQKRPGAPAAAPAAKRPRDEVEEDEAVEGVEDPDPNVIEIESLGTGPGSEARFRVGDLEISAECRRGLNFVTLGLDDNEIDGFIYFDTLSSSADVEKLVDWIDGLPVGTVVLGAAKESAGGGAGNPQQLEAAAAMAAPGGGWEALKRLGSSGRALRPHQTYVLCGAKDAEPGAACERYGPGGQPCKLRIVKESILGIMDSQELVLEEDLGQTHPAPQVRPLPAPITAAGAVKVAALRAPAAGRPPAGRPPAAEDSKAQCQVQGPNKSGNYRVVCRLPQRRDETNGLSPPVNVTGPWRVTADEAELDGDEFLVAHDEGGLKLLMRRKSELFQAAPTGVPAQAGAAAAAARGQVAGGTWMPGPQPRPRPPLSAVPPWPRPAQTQPHARPPAPGMTVRPRAAVLLAGTVIRNSGSFGLIQQEAGGADLSVLATNCPGSGFSVPQVGTRVLYLVKPDPKTGVPTVTIAQAQGGRPGAAAAARPARQAPQAQQGGGGPQQPRGQPPRPRAPAGRASIAPKEECDDADGDFETCGSLIKSLLLKQNHGPDSASPERDVQEEDVVSEDVEDGLEPEEPEEEEPEEEEEVSGGETPEPMACKRAAEKCAKKYSLSVDATWRLEDLLTHRSRVHGTPEGLTEDLRQIAKHLERSSNPSAVLMKRSTEWAEGPIPDPDGDAAKAPIVKTRGQRGGIRLRQKALRVQGPADGEAPPRAPRAPPPWRAAEQAA